MMSIKFFYWERLFRLPSFDSFTTCWMVWGKVWMCKNELDHWVQSWVQEYKWDCSWINFVMECTVLYWQEKALMLLGINNWHLMKNTFHSRIVGRLIHTSGTRGIHKKRHTTFRWTREMVCGDGIVWSKVFFWRTVCVTRQIIRLKHRYFICTVIEFHNRISWRRVLTWQTSSVSILHLQVHRSLLRSEEPTHRHY